MKLRDIIEVHWNDSYSNGRWTKFEDLKEWHDGGCRIISVGYLVAESRESLTIACSVGANEVGGLWNIPRKMISKIKVLKGSGRLISKRRKKRKEQN